MNKLIFPGPPISTQTIYKFTCCNGYPHQYMTDKGKSIKEEYQWRAKSQWKEELYYKPMKVKVDLFFKDKLRRDIDNFNKILFDSLTGIVWFDDSQVSELTVRKFVDKKEPRVEVEINK